MAYTEKKSLQNKYTNKNKQNKKTAVSIYGINNRRYEQYSENKDPGQLFGASLNKKKVIKTKCNISKSVIYIQ